MRTGAKRRCRGPRGVTLIEAMATMVVLLLGIMAVALLLLQTVKSNRRNLSQAQAATLAERELERILAMGCRPPPNAMSCPNIQALDGQVLGPFYWSAGGEMTTTAPAGPSREYEVLVDVDPGQEGSEVVSRPVGPSGLTSSATVNVRVTVRWREAGEGADAPFEAIALQTRMAP